MPENIGMPLRVSDAPKDVLHIHHSPMSVSVRARKRETCARAGSLRKMCLNLRMMSFAELRLPIVAVLSYTLSASSSTVLLGLLTAASSLPSELTDRVSLLTTTGAGLFSELTARLSPLSNLSDLPLWSTLRPGKINCTGTQGVGRWRVEIGLRAWICCRC